MGAQLCSLGFS
jgi:hypothetical protein